MGAHPYGAQLRPQQQSKNLPRVNPPAEVSNPISIIRERKKTTRWVIFSFLVKRGDTEVRATPRNTLKTLHFYGMDARVSQ